MGGWQRFKTGLAVVGGCAALSVLLPPLGALFNAVGSVTLLALAAYAAFRGWAFMESVVEASRRPTTVRRNLKGAPERPVTRNQEIERSDHPSQGAELSADQRSRRLKVWPETDRHSRLGLPFRGR